MAKTSHNLSVLAQNRGDYPEAERQCSHALAIFEELGDRAGMADTYHDLGVLAHRGRDYPGAERQYSRALAIFEELGDRAHMARCYHAPHMSWTVAASVLVTPTPPGVNNHGEVIGLVRSDPSLGHPDLQFVLVDVPRAVEGFPSPEFGYTYAVNLMRPHSRGTIRLSGGTPDHHPLIDPNYYGDSRDLDAVVSGLRIARRIGAASAMDAWRAGEVAPGSDWDSDEALQKYALSRVASYFHPVGTCKMGRDALAVVDTRLRVHGLEGLRIVDASIMPSIPSANTNATVYAIAERAAELIATG
jgi:choline dehydrogenase